jgi:DNA-directed RNA polymerase subunit RPC12/RpoP
LLAILLATLCALGLASTSLAQGGDLTLTVTKSWGYAWRGEMQGTFTLKASAPPDLSRVTFLLDGEPLAEVVVAPFATKLTTDDYPLGAHTLSASAVAADGGTLRSKQEHVTFVSAERGWQTALSIAGPIVGLVVGFVVIMTVVSLVGQRGRKATPGAARCYGALGGALCPRCGRPFALHAWSVHFFSRRYERCPHCGRWSMVGAASPAELRAAEEAEAQATAADEGVPPPSAEDDLRRALDDSRYVDE